MSTNEKVTWDTRDLCAVTGLCLDSVQKMVTRPTFPDCLVPTGDANGRRMWLAEDVREWLKEQRGQVPHARAKRKDAA